jgi:basic amino acid/polyamine antiporter, APA family
MSRHKIPNKKRIGLWPVISLVVGNIIGSGVFLLPSSLAPYGLYSLAGWGISAAGAVLLALTFGALSKRITQTGGPHAYVQAAMGNVPGFFTAWSYWLLSWISNTALVIGAVSYLSVICGGFSKPLAITIELVLLFAVGALNLLGIRLTGRVELIVTTLKLIPLILIPLLGLYFMDFSNFTEATVVLTDVPSTEVLLKTVTLLVFWGFLGLETGTVPSGEVEHPKRTIPLGTIIGTLIAAGVYFAGMVVMLGVMSQEKLMASSAPYADLAHHIFGGSWGIPVAIAAIISCLSALNGWTLITARIPLGAAEEGLFPKFFEKRNRFGSPHWGVILSTLCSAPLLFISANDNLITQFNCILEISVAMLLVIYCVTMVCFLMIWMNEKKNRNLIEPLIALGALLFVIWALIGVQPKLIFFAAIATIIGAPFYWLRNKKN